MDELVFLTARLGVVGAALVTGTLFAFSAFIMAALRRLPAAEGIRAMQQINRTIYTPWFMVPFGGTTVLSALAIVLGVVQAEEPWSRPMIVAGGCFVVGVFLITGVRNVPLNTRLDQLDADAPDVADFWRGYLATWTRWNHVRSIAGVLAIAAFTHAAAAMEALE